MAPNRGLSLHLQDAAGDLSSLELFVSGVIRGLLHSNWLLFLLLLLVLLLLLLRKMQTKDGR